MLDISPGTKLQDFREEWASASRKEQIQFSETALTTFGAVVLPVLGVFTIPPAFTAGEVMPLFYSICIAIVWVMVAMGSPASNLAEWYY